MRSSSAGRTCSPATGRTASGGPDADGWFRTGDIAYADPDGDLFLVDRTKELILVSGFNVYPREVEQVLATHPDVHEVAVIGVAHPYTGETVKALVVPRKGTSPSADELDRARGAPAGPVQVPDLVELVDRAAALVERQGRQGPVARPRRRALMAPRPRHRGSSSWSGPAATCARTRSLWSTRSAARSTSGGGPATSRMSRSRSGRVDRPDPGRPGRRSRARRAAGRPRPVAPRAAADAQLGTDSACSSHSRWVLSEAWVSATSAVVAGRLGAGQPRLELLDGLAQPDDQWRVGRDDRPGRGGRLADPALRVLERVLEAPARLAWHVADLLPPVVDRAQPLAGAGRVGSGVERLGLGNERLLGLEVGHLLLVAGAEDLGAAGEEGVLRRLEPRPEPVVDLARCAAGGLPLGHQVAEPSRGRRPLGRLGELLGLAGQPLLALRAASPRCCSSVAKWLRRRASKRRRAAEKLAHSSPSVVRSTPRIVFQVSTMARNRSLVPRQSSLAGEPLRLGDQLPLPVGGGRCCGSTLLTAGAPSARRPSRARRRAG